MTEPTGKGVIHRGTQKNVQFICCSVPGCTETMNVPIKGTVKPGDVILNMARRRGWHIVNDGRKVRQCPMHNGRVKEVSPDQIADLAARFKVWLSSMHPDFEARKKALIVELARLGISKVTEAKNEAHRQALLDLLPEQPPQEPDMAKPNPELAAASMGLVPLSESLKLPSDAARAQRRRVFHEIEECYGDRQYKTGFSDSYIATKLAVAVNMVADVREMNFGPAGPDPRIVALRDQIAGLEVRIVQIEEAALAIMDQAETKAKELRRDIASLLDKINKLEGFM